MALHMLISPEEIERKIKELALEISRDYKKITTVTVLEGAKIFSEKLRQELQSLDIIVKNKNIKVSSYGNRSESSGEIKVAIGIDENLENEDMLIVEDIVDTGATMNFLINYLFENNAKSVKICALTDKPARRKIPLKIDYRGFVVPDKFIVGFGIDYKKKYRELPYIGYVDINN